MIDVNKGKILISIDGDDFRHKIDYLKTIPDKSYNQRTKIHSFPLNDYNIGCIIVYSIRFSETVTKRASILFNNEGDLIKNRYDKSCKRIIKLNTLFSHQESGVKFLSSRRRAMLCDDMGLGKTLTVIASLPDSSCGVVICPASVKPVWNAEFDKWRHGDFKISVLQGRKSFRMPEENEFIILNYDILPDVDVIKKLETNDDMFLVMDEIHKCKSYKSNRTKKCAALSRQFKNVFGLTGTPMPNNPGELWSEIKVLNIHNRVFGSFDNFKRLFKCKIKIINKQRIIEWGNPTKGAVERIKKHILVRKKEQVFDLPEQLRTVINIPIDKNAVRQLDALSDEFGDLLQYKNKPIPFELISKYRKISSTFKIPYMMNIVKDHIESKTPLVVFSCHRDPILELKKLKNYGVIMGDTPHKIRESNMFNFQNGVLDGIGMTKSGTEGITLTRACRMLVVDYGYSFGENKQFEGRIHRIGQDRKCVYLILMLDHYIDKRLFEILYIKSKYDQAITDSVSFDYPKSKLLLSIGGK